MKILKILIWTAIGISCLAGGWSFVDCFQDRSFQVNPSVLCDCAGFFFSRATLLFIACGAVVLAGTGLVLIVRNSVPPTESQKQAIRKLIKASSLFVILAGLFIASFALYAGFMHNPQGEFYSESTGKIEYGYSFLLFLSWFLPVVLLGALVIGLEWALNKLVQHIKMVNQCA